MELSQLRYFVALSQELNFGRAAARVHVSQPALSLQIKKLEGELGAPLLERSSRRVRLTAAGEKFLPHAMAILDRLERGVREMKETREGLSGRLRVGAIPTIGPYLMPGVIRRIRQMAPRLVLELFEETTSAQLELISEGRLDIGVMSLPIPASGLVSRSLGKEPFFLAVSRRHPLAARRQISKREMEKEKMLVLQEGHCFGNQSLEYCKKSRQDPHIIFQGSSLTSVMNLAASGEGITLVPRMAAVPRRNPGLVFVPLAPPAPQRDIALVWRVSAPLGKTERFFMETVESIFKVMNQS